MTEISFCPKCKGVNVYPDGNLWMCPDCTNEFNEADFAAAIAASGPKVIRDANGNVLATGDTVTVIKDLKIKGSSAVVKVGMKVKNIRLIEEAEDGHDIACRIDGIGAINLKSEFVKKV